MPLDVHTLTIKRMPQTKSNLAALQRKNSALDARSSNQLDSLLDDAAAQRDHTAAPLPLLALQKILLTLVVLDYVASATTKQQRPEITLARLRSQLPASTARILIHNLTIIILTNYVINNLINYELAKLTAQI